MSIKRPLLFLTLVLALAALACQLGDSISDDEDSNELNAAAQVDTPTPAPTRHPTGPAGEKYALWVDGPHLRGVNIWQAIVVPELDGLEFKGSGAVGPPFVQADFDRLAELGANYVSISGPGLFTERPPFAIDPGVQANLDNLLTMIGNADMFATIGFRTGPGRSEFSLCCGGDSYFEDYFNDTIWEDPAAQTAWVAMWRHTAERYRDHPTVAGYKLMVEPNVAGFFDIYDPDEFYAEHRGTSFDWNTLYPQLIAGIREVDTTTPILVGGEGWSGVGWLAYLEPHPDPRLVYVVHQYEPQDDYSHQGPRGRHTYPDNFDADYDGEDERFDRAWLDAFLKPVDDYKSATGAPVTVDEFGANRWVPGAAGYIGDQMSLFEARGLNYALWEWSPSWAPFAEDVHDMNYLLGPDPDNLEPVDSELQAVIQGYWARNSVRPSNYGTDNDS